MRMIALNNGRKKSMESGNTGDSRGSLLNVEIVSGDTGDSRWSLLSDEIVSATDIIQWTVEMVYMKRPMRNRDFRIPVCRPFVLQVT